jgi:hypothetical protein
MSRKHLTLLQSLSTLELIPVQPPSQSSANISFHEDEFEMPDFDHNKQQQHTLYLTDTVVDHSHSEEEYDDISNLDDQFMAMDINTPQDDWPQDHYQAIQPYEAMATTSFSVDSSGTTVAYADPAASPNSDYSCFNGYDYYNDYDYYNENFDSIHILDTPMTPANYSNTASSNSSSNTYPYPLQYSLLS